MNGANSLGFTYKRYNEMMRDFCEFCGIPFLDLSRKSGINQYNISKWSGDGIRPNAQGYVWEYNCEKCLVNTCFITCQFKVNRLKKYCTDSMHPSTNGYLQIADTIFAAFLSII